MLADLKGEDVEIAAPPSAATEPRNPLWEKPKRDYQRAAEQTAEAAASSSAPEAEPEFKPEPDVVNLLKPEAPAQPAPPEQKLPEADSQSTAAAAPAKMQSPQADKEIVQRLDMMEKRLSLLETRMDGQEENLHRILTMLVEWVENDVRSKESYNNAGRAA